MTLSPELAALRDEAMATSCDSWAIQKRWKLSGRGDMAGPCPNSDCPDGGGTDRFSINTRKNVFNCRKCGISGEGVISLVMATEHVEFARACEIITGRAVSDPLDEARAAENRRKADAAAQKKADDEAVFRERARIEASRIWREGERIDFWRRSIVGDYLALRALDPADVGDGKMVALRFHPDLSWTEPYEDPVSGSKGWQTVHVGPAMLAAIQMPDGRFGGVHRTWVDLGAPKGKLQLPPDAAGKERVAKKVLGSMKGGAIRLYTPEGARRIVMGEGIESTLTPACHAIEPDTAYWAGIAIGNMGGKALRIDGRIVPRHPDMDDLGMFLPPDWCEELVYLGEGDDPQSEDKCVRGLRRARRLREAARATRPELKPLSIIFVPPGEPGKDMNDIAMSELAELSGDELAGSKSAAASGDQ